MDLWTERQEIDIPDRLFFLFSFFFPDYNAWPGFGRIMIDCSFSRSILPALTVYDLVLQRVKRTIAITAAKPNNTAPMTIRAYCQDSNPATLLEEQVAPLQSAVH